MYNVPGVQDYVIAGNGFLKERLLFGTAYPFIGFKEGVEGFVNLPFDRDILPNLLWKNAARALNLTIKE